MKPPRLLLMSALAGLALAGCSGLPGDSGPSDPAAAPLVTVPSTPAPESPRIVPPSGLASGEPPSVGLPPLPDPSTEPTAVTPAPETGDGTQPGPPQEDAPESPSPSAVPQPSPVPSSGPSADPSAPSENSGPPSGNGSGPGPDPSAGSPRTSSGYAVPLTLFYIAVDDGGRIGALIGCNDSLVPVTTEPVSTMDPLAETMRRLVGNGQPFVGRAGLLNPLWQSRLTYMGSQVDETTVTVELGGEVVPAGTCDVPRIEYMLKQAAMTATGAREAVILVNGVPIEDVLSTR